MEPSTSIPDALVGVGQALSALILSSELVFTSDDAAASVALLPTANETLRRLLEAPGTDASGTLTDAGLSAVLAGLPYNAAPSDAGLFAADTQLL